MWVLLFKGGSLPLMTKYWKPAFLIVFTIVVCNLLLWIQVAGSSSNSLLTNKYTLSYTTVIILYGFIIESVRTSGKELRINILLLCVSILLLVFNYMPIRPLYNTIQLPIINYLTAPMVDSNSARVIIGVMTGILIARSIFSHPKST